MSIGWWIEGICLVKDNNRLLGNRVVWKSNEIVSTLGECLVLKLEWNFFFRWIQIELSLCGQDKKIFCCDY